MKLTDVILIRGGHHRRREGVHTESIRADVVTGETIELRKFACMTGAKVEEVLHTLPH